MESYFNSLFFNPHLILDSLTNFARLSHVDLPQTALTDDKSGISENHIADFEKGVLQIWIIFYFEMNRLIKMNLHYDWRPVLDVKSWLPKLRAIQTLFANNSEQNPFYEFILAQAFALCGDEKAIKILWNYQRNPQFLDTTLSQFSTMSKELLETGEKLLQLVDPQHLHMSKNLTDLVNNRHMAMVELGTPRALQSSMAQNISIEFSDMGFADHENNQHASYVAQVLLGQPKHDTEPSGLVHAYVLPTTGQLSWHQIVNQLNSTLLAILTDMLTKNISYDVINISLAHYGFNSGLPISVEFLESEEVKKLHQTMNQLTKMGSVVCLAAGNENFITPSTSLGQNTEIYNFIALLDPRFFVVGATSDNDTISEFSSPGNVFHHPDLATTGENFYVWNEKTLTEVDGTSFASPHVARAITMMRSVNPKIDAETIQAILKNTAQDIPTASIAFEGAGIAQFDFAIFMAHTLNKNQLIDTKELCQTLRIPENLVALLTKQAKKIKQEVKRQNTFNEGYGL